MTTAEHRREVYLNICEAKRNYARERFKYTYELPQRCVNRTDGEIECILQKMKDRANALHKKKWEAKHGVTWDEGYALGLHKRGKKPIYTAEEKREMLRERRRAEYQRRKKKLAGQQ